MQVVRFGTRSHGIEGRVRLPNCRRAAAGGGSRSHSTNHFHEQHWKNRSSTVAQAAYAVWDATDVRATPVGPLLTESYSIRTNALTDTARW